MNARKMNKSETAGVLARTPLAAKAFEGAAPGLMDAADLAMITEATNRDQGRETKVPVSLAAVEKSTENDNQLSFRNEKNKEQKQMIVDFRKSNPEPKPVTAPDNILQYILHRESPDYELDELELEDKSNFKAKVIANGGLYKREEVIDDHIMKFNHIAIFHNVEYNSMLFHCLSLAGYDQKKLRHLGQEIECSSVEFVKKVQNSFGNSRTPLQWKGVFYAFTGETCIHAFEVYSDLQEIAAYAGLGKEEIFLKFKSMMPYQIRHLFNDKENIIECICRWAGQYGPLMGL